MRAAHLALLLTILGLQACDRPTDPPPASTLTAAELAAEPKAPSTPAPAAADADIAPVSAPPDSVEPVDAADAGPVLIELMSETAYFNEQRQYVVDLLERDMAYMTFVLRTDEGRPVRGAQLKYDISGTSRIVPIGENAMTDDSGWVEIGVIGGKMGGDKLTVTYGERKLEVLINVISLKAAGFAGLDESAGSLRWEQLMKARLRFAEDNKVTADFPADVAAQNGKTVRLIGFMMPLEPEREQKHFLLTSNPPSCFFHVPGGPAGAVEVFAAKGIEASWDPLLIEGRFETVEGGELGVVYRLRDARVVSR
ncbi:MAG TPA: DUF3299 domain-containing protein [Fontimonas sp.]